MHRSVTKTNIFYISFIIAVAAVFFAALVRPVAAQVPPATPGAATTLQQRIEQRKTERNVTLSEPEYKRLISVCNAAQTKIRAVQQKATPAVAKRAETYRQIDGKLWVTIGKLKLANKDTFNLETNRTMLAAKIATTQQTGANYLQSLDDTLAIDCKVDPAGFKALLETARIYHTQLRDQSADTRNYITNDVKNSLNDYAVDLQAKSSTGENQ